MKYHCKKCPDYELYGKIYFDSVTRALYCDKHIEVAWKEKDIIKEMHSLIKQNRKIENRAKKMGLK